MTTSDHLSLSKKFRYNEDRLSSLPEGVVGHILSHLSTKEAVQTSVLAKCWRYKCESIYNIKVKLPVPITRNDEEPFIRFMHTILRGSLNIRSFNLDCCGFGRHMETWLSRVFQKKAENVELFITPRFLERDSIILPEALPSCTSLRQLKVHFSSSQIQGTLRVPIKIYFPNLTSLSLSGLEILNNSDSADTLKCDFPVLKTLEISYCRWLNFVFIEIFAPTLRTFKHMLSNGGPNLDHIIKIHGSTLSRFEDSGTIPGNVSFVGSRVLSADLIVHGYGVFRLLKRGNAGSRIRSLMKECLDLTKLRLSSFVVGFLAEMTSAPPLPKYNMLKEIILSHSVWEYPSPNIEALFELLHAAPYLSVLVINMAAVCFFDSRNGYDYDTVEFLPSCIVTQLKKVELTDFINKEPQYRLAKFLLKNASVLDEFSVSCLIEKEKILKRLSKYPKASTSLKLVVT